MANPLLVAAIVAIVLVVGVLLAAGGGPAPVPAPAAMCPVSFVPQPAAQQWAQDAEGAYTCPGTAVAGYCVLDADVGATYCANDPGCLGYFTYPAGLTPITAVTNPSVQLTAVPPSGATSYGWTSFYKKTFNVKN